MYARGAILGLTRDTGREHIVKATLQSLAFQTRDVLDAMQKDSGIELKKLQVDGGASANNFLMQFQADILGADVERPQVIESTAQGAAYLAGMAAGLWEKDQIVGNRRVDQTFSPVIDQTKRQVLYAGWQKAVKRSMGWIELDGVVESSSLRNMVFRYSSTISYGLVPEKSLRLAPQE